MGSTCRNMSTCAGGDMPPPACCSGAALELIWCLGHEGAVATAGVLAIMMLGTITQEAALMACQPSSVAMGCPAESSWQLWLRHGHRLISKLQLA